MHAEVIEFFPFRMSKRFKLLFLGENEGYLRDIGCYVDAKVPLSEQSDREQTLNHQLDRFIRGENYRGRLRIATNSLVLDLEGIVCIESSRRFKLYLGCLFCCSGFSYSRLPCDRRRLSANSSATDKNSCHKYDWEYDTALEASGGHRFSPRALHQDS